MINLPGYFYTGAWITLVVLFLIVEVLAWQDSGRGDTLTEHIRWLVRHRVIWFAGIGAAIWAFLHLFFGMD